METESFETWEAVPGQVKNIVVKRCRAYAAEAEAEEATKSAEAVMQIAYMEKLRAEAPPAAQESMAEAFEKYGAVHRELLFAPSNIEKMIATAFDAAQQVLGGGDEKTWTALPEEYRAIVGNRLGEEQMRMARLIAYKQAGDVVQETVTQMMMAVGQDIGRPGFTAGMVGGATAASDGVSHVDHMIVNAIDVAVRKLLSVGQTVDPEAS